MARATEVSMVAWPSYVAGSRTWRVENMDTSMRTVIRHALLADVPVQAVDHVTFHAWDGLVESSLIAHRMGQLPIRGLDPLVFELKFKAPEDAPLTWVTANHITGDNNRVVRGVDHEEPFLLVPLLAGQRVHLTCTTTLGTGRRKATWNSVFPVIKVETNKEDPCPFTITVETTGALTPTEAMDRALVSSIHTFSRIVSRM